MPLFGQHCSYYFSKSAPLDDTESAVFKLFSSSHLDAGYPTHFPKKKLNLLFFSFLSLSLFNAVFDAVFANVLVGMEKNFNRLD